jgi:hypothetical protein
LTFVSGLSGSSVTEVVCTTLGWLFIFQLLLCAGCSVLDTEAQNGVSSCIYTLSNSHTPSFLDTHPEFQSLVCNFARRTTGSKALTKQAGFCPNPLQPINMGSCQMSQKKPTKRMSSHICGYFVLPRDSSTCMRCRFCTIASSSLLVM